MPPFGTPGTIIFAMQEKEDINLTLKWRSERYDLIIIKREPWLGGERGGVVTIRF